MEPTFVAWAAGFFDGEGCVLIVRLATGTHRIGVDVAQVDRRPLDALAARWGGAVDLYGAGRPGHRPAHHWRLSGAAALAFLAEIRPYLIVKAAVADLALTYPLGGRGVRVTPDVHVIREEIFRRIRAHNDRSF